MPNDYVTTTAEVRGVIAWRHQSHRDNLTPEAFDRWLAQHDAEVLAAADREDDTAELLAEIRRLTRIIDNALTLEHKPDASKRDMAAALKGNNNT